MDTSYIGNGVLLSPDSSQEWPISWAAWRQVPPRRCRCLAEQLRTPFRKDHISHWWGNAAGRLGKPQHCTSIIQDDTPHHWQVFPLKEPHSEGIPRHLPYHCHVAQHARTISASQKKSHDKALAYSAFSATK
jgi:hypothetical protein